MFGQDVDVYGKANGLISTAVVIAGTIGGTQSVAEGELSCPVNKIGSKADLDREPDRRVPEQGQLADHDDR